MIYDEDELDDDDYVLDDAISNRTYLWSLDPATGTVPIPYMIQDDIRPEIRDRIERAILEYDQKTCIRYIRQIIGAIGFLLPFITFL